MEHPIKSWLNRHNLKQWMFAEMIGVDESTLSCYISGSITITPPRAVTIERETKRVDPNDFIYAIDLIFGEKEAV